MILKGIVFFKISIQKLIELDVCQIYALVIHMDKICEREFD